MGITILGWVLIVLGVICIIAGTGLCIFFCSMNEKLYGIISVVIGFVLGLVLIIGPIIYSTTETGKRSYKDQQSDFSGGISRTVTVYDFNGNIIKQYSGEFDIETDNATYILFDDQYGKRHIIYYTTGTIIIDEN